MPRKRMRSGDRPGLQNRRAAGHPVTGGFDPHSLPPFFNDLRDACRGARIYAEHSDLLQTQTGSSILDGQS